MPITINGIGTWYYGRRNAHSYQGKCEFCQRSGPLSTYDTTLFFMVFFVPIIPLGKRKIINQCPACKRHKAMSLAKWEKLRSQTITDLVNAYCRDPSDKAKAWEAVQTTLYFRADQAFTGLATLVEASFPDDPDILSGLGEAHQFFGQIDLAAEFFQKSLAIRFDRAVARNLATLHLRQGQPDKALATLQYVFQNHVEEEIPLLGNLVAAFQARGQHAQALQLLEQIAGVFPQTAQGKNRKQWAMWRKISEKHAGTNRPVKSKTIWKGDGFHTTDAWRFRLPRLISLVVLLTAAIVYFGCAFYRGRNREVYLVNGLSRPYTVAIDDRSITLPPYNNASISVPEGHHTLHITGDGVTIPDQQIDLHTNFFHRPFIHKVFVINPDRVAILATQTCVYANVPPAAPPDVFHVGQALYDLSDIDYVFTSFPQELHVSNRERLVVKHRLAFYDRPMRAWMLQRIEEDLGHEAAAALVQRHLVQDPGDDASLHYLGLLAKEEILPLLRSRLADRPVRIQWHRAYQSVAERLDPTHNLLQEYSALLATEPQNPDLQYLLGRITPDRATAMRLHQQAAMANPPCVFALHAMAYDCWMSAKFDQAISYWDQASKRGLDPDLFTSPYTDALLANGQFLVALAANYERQSRHPFTDDPSDYLTATELQMETLILMNRRAEAQQCLAKCVADLQSNSDQQLFENYLKQSLAYCSGDLASYVKQDANLPGNWPKFRIALTTHQLAEADQWLRAIEAENKSIPASTSLLMYAAAAEARQGPLAEQYLQRAIKALRKGDADERKLANWFSGEAPPPRQEMLDCQCSPTEKAIILTALAFRFVEHQKPLLERARRYDCHLVFPHLTLKRIITSQLSSPT